MARLKHVIAKPNNTTIVIYYSLDKKELRYPTGIKISSTKLKSGKYSDWDYISKLIKPSVRGYEESNKRIQELVNKANKILSEHFTKGAILSPDELKGLLDAKEQAIAENANTLVVESYKKFHSIKENQFNATNTSQSLKDFTSTLNLLIDFETYKEATYKIHHLGMPWFREFLNFMRLPHENDLVNGKIYISHGRLQGKTIKKRFDVIAQFLGYLRENKIVTHELVDEVKKFRSKEIKVPKTEKTTLTIDEVHQLYNKKFTEPLHTQIKDCFVFLCFTGIRYSDYLLFDAKYIRQSRKSKDLIYDRKAQKTKNSSGLSYKVPLCKTALEILKKYDNKLPVVTNPNYWIKAALETTDLFRETTNKIDKVTGKEKLRYECVSMHKGRDTFITNLVDVTPLNQLMKYTGHSKLSTLQGYIDPSREVETSPIKIFDK